LPGPAFVDLRAGVAGLSIAAAVFLGMGCVDLDKPPAVKQCVAAGGCWNGPPAPTSDARGANDDVEQADRRAVDEPAGSKEDLGQDQRAESDAGPDGTDLPENKDVAGTEPRAAEVAAPSDLGSDVGVDTKVPHEGGSDRGRDLGTDPGPDQGDETGDAAADDVAKEDVVKDDIVKVDVAGPEAPRDLGNADVPNTACPAVNPVTGGHIAFETKGAVCFVTCDDIQYGWGCDSFNETNRAVQVNGTSVKCGAALPAKKNPGNYYYFEIGPGLNTWDAIHWSGTPNASCPTPTGGFTP
jgi:hypothetical protein